MATESPSDLPPGGAPEEKRRRRDQRTWRELLELIASGEAVALVGAGLSVAAGYPSWPALLKQLAERANALRPGSITSDAPVGDVLGYAETIRSEFDRRRGREAYHNELGRIFRRSEEEQPRLIQQIHRDLVGLPFRAFLTTNYDSVLECALHLSRPDLGRPESVWVWNGRKEHISPAVRGIAVGGDVRHVIHLHGYYDQPAGIILCRDDYTQAYGIRRLAAPRARLESDAPLPQLPDVVGQAFPTNLFLLTAGLLATRRVVFVGFSLDDPYFTEVLAHVCDALWEWGSSVHFAVLPFDPHREDAMRDRARVLKETMGIETVPYPVVDNDHSELAKLVSEVQLEVATANAAPRVSFPASASPHVDKTLVQVPEWVRKSNAAQLKGIRNREG